MRFFEDIETGEKAQKTIRITETAIQQYADLTGDHNPIHLDEKYAAASKFGRRVAHGGLGASHITGIIGSELPGHGSISLGLEFRFHNPIFIDDDVLCTVEILEKRPGFKMITMGLSCFVGDRKCITGTAKIIAPSRNASP